MSRLLICSNAERRNKILDEAILHTSALCRNNVKQVRTWGMVQHLVAFGFFHLYSAGSLGTFIKKYAPSPMPHPISAHNNCFLANHMNKARLQVREENKCPTSKNSKCCCSKPLITGFTICLTLFYWSDAFRDTGDSFMLMYKLSSSVTWTLGGSPQAPCQIIH